MLSSSFETKAREKVIEPISTHVQYSICGTWLDLLFCIASGTLILSYMDIILLLICRIKKALKY